MIAKSWKNYRNAVKRYNHYKNREGYEDEPAKKEAKTLMGINLGIFIIGVIVLLSLLIIGVVATVQCNQKGFIPMWSMFVLLGCMIVFFPWFGWLIAIAMIIIWLVRCRSSS